MFRYFGLIGCAVGLLSATTWASAPTFSLKLAGLNGQIFRDIECVDSGDCPAGSECVLTEVTFPGFFEDRCSPISVIPEGMIEPGDTITIEAFIIGWDADPESGFCNGETHEVCNVKFPDCTRDHCRLTGGYCNDNNDCTEGDICIPDDCLATPLLGSSQWIMDAASFSSTTIPAARPFNIAELGCGQDSDCWHGALTPAQCTCANATCLLGGYCTAEASIYLDLVRFDYLFAGQLHQYLVTGGTPGIPNITYLGALLGTGLRDRGHCDGGSNANSLCFFESDCDSEVCKRTEKYLGSLWLEIPLTAGGTYVLDFVRGLNYTYATDERAIFLPEPDYEPLTIELCDPCVDFDVEAECPAPPNVCQVYACFPDNCVAECVRSPRTCENACDRCVVMEGGCVPFGACCLEDGTCVKKSAAQCSAAGGNYKGNCTICAPDTCKAYGACCIPREGEEPPWACTEAFEEDCLGTFKGDGTVCGDGSICEVTECPTGTMTFSDPLDGTTDARQPRDINNAAALQGIDTIMASGPVGAADLICWELCETLVEGAANDIASVTEGTPGNYTITLNRRITPGAVTKVTYLPVSGAVSVGTFISLPADSTADGVSNTADILGLIDCCLNQVCTPAWGVYSCDIDNSAVVNTADILRLIDLLNGAGQFVQPWNLASPYDGGECP
ncbi:MAG: hypothetical protein JSU63_19155 [Phycisphaerales bacterium]|nr:MAG: hypothetical protein JSU63_19155 [Phycisphaerales bacterium]